MEFLPDTKSVEENIKLYKKSKKLNKQQTLSNFDEILNKMSTSQMQLADYMRLNQEKKEDKKSLIDEIKRSLGSGLSDEMKSTVIYFLKRKIDPSNKFESYVKILEDNIHEAKRDIAKIDLTIGDLDSELNQQSTQLTELGNRKSEIGHLISKKELLISEIGEFERSCQTLRKKIEEKEEEIVSLKAKALSLKDILGEELGECMIKVKSLVDKFEFIDKEEVSVEGSDIDLELEMQKHKKELEEIEEKNRRDLEIFRMELEIKFDNLFHNKKSELKAVRKEEKKKLEQQLNECDEKIKHLVDSIKLCEEEKAGIELITKRIKEKTDKLNAIKQDCTILVSENAKLHKISKEETDKYIEWIKKIHNRTGTTTSLMVPKDPNKGKRGSKFLSMIGLGGSNEKK